MKTKSLLMYVTLALAAASGLSQPSRTKTVADHSSIIGIWRCQMDGLPAVTLTVTDESGSLTGAILFYLHRRDPGQPVTATPGVPEPLFNPKFDGKALTFQVSHRRAHPPGSLQDAAVPFELKLTSDDKGELVNEDEHDPNAPSFVFVRSAY
jgi:hypothetical protein